MNKVASIFMIIAALSSSFSIAASTLNSNAGQSGLDINSTSENYSEAEKKSKLRLLVGVTPSVKGDTNLIAKNLVSRANKIFGDSYITPFAQLELAGVHNVATDSSDYYSLLSTVSAEGKRQGSVMDFYNADLMIIITGQADASGLKGYANTETGYAVGHQSAAPNKRNSFIHELSLLLKAEQHIDDSKNILDSEILKNRSQSSSTNSVNIYYTGSGLSDHAMPGQIKSYSANVTGGQISSIKWYYKFSTYENRDWILVHDYILGSSNSHFSKKFNYSQTYGSITLKCEVTFDTGEVVEDLHYIEWDNFLK